MNHTIDIPAALNRLHTLISRMGYECEIITPDELFVFTASTYTLSRERITLNINVTANGENSNIGKGNYIALEVFFPCNITEEEDEAHLAVLIMQLIEEVDMIAIQYIADSQQILLSRVDCIAPELPDSYIINHILTPAINEFLHIFCIIESSMEEPIIHNPTKQYLN